MNIIPRPLKVERRQGKLDLSTISDIKIDADLDGCSALIDSVFTRGEGGASLQVVRDASCPDEGYRIEIAPDGAKIFASTQRGAVWAVQTLRVAGLRAV